MPDDVDARRGADGAPSPFDETSPDLVGEELGDGARIWRVYDRVARDEDRERVGNWNRGLDNLALFAGLFSAVTTAFIIEAQQDTEPDYARLTFLVLNASAAGVPFREEPFLIDASVRVTNCLWIASLILSLTAALIAIMGKDWIRMYESRPICNPRQWAEIRTYRLACVERWYMSGVIASAPVLLHISLVLFAAGLVIFVAPDPFSQHLALGLALAAGGLYLVTVLSAILFPTSPFKSPATQAFRGAFGSIWTSLYQRLVYPTKRRPVALLQQATLIIGAVLSLSLPPGILPLERSQRRRLRRVDFSTVWEHLFSRNQGRSWGHSPARLAKAFWTRLAASASSLHVRLLSALGEYRNRRQRPRIRPWHITARSYLRRIDLSDRWSETRSQPTPDLLAQSLSHLNAMTQSTDVFHSILVALGDISIGRQVAPLVSLDLKSRLSTEIRHKWQKAELLTLSRYILADRHLSDSPLIPPFKVYLRFVRKDTAIKSESIVFALVVLKQRFIHGAAVNHYLPEIFTQPHTLQYLLPRVDSYEVVVVLFLRYWDHLGSDRSMKLHRELRARLISWLNWDEVKPKLNRRFGASPDLLELLVFSLDYMQTDMVTIACALILKVLDGEEHPCLVFAFGHTSPRVAGAAWAALPAYSPLASMQAFDSLELALPLAQFAPRNREQSVAPLVSDGQRAGTVCLLRSIVRLLFPSRHFQNMSHDLGRDGPWNLRTLELCVRCLHTHLQSRSVIDGYLDIIALMLDNSVLIRVSALWQSLTLTRPIRTADRDVINILTAIARRLTGLLTSDVTDNRARLFCRFSFSEVTDYKGNPVAWDLGSYLRTVAGRLSQLDPSTAVSLRRLLRFLRTVRPLCARREDLCAAWQRIGIAPDDEYHDSFWDAEDFDLAGLRNPDAPGVTSAGASSPGDMNPPGDREEFSALHALDAAMR